MLIIYHEKWTTVIANYLLVSIHVATFKSKNVYFGTRPVPCPWQVLRERPYVQRVCLLICPDNIQGHFTSCMVSAGNDDFTRELSESSTIT